MKWYLSMSLLIKLKQATQFCYSACVICLSQNTLNYLYLYLFMHKSPCRLLPAVIRLYSVCSQVEDKLPHLKAIIQYKDALKEKRPNLYTVSTQSAYEEHEKIDSFSSEASSEWLCLCAAVGRVHGARTWRARRTPRHHHLQPEAQPMLHAHLHLRNHRAAQRSHAQSR